MPRKKEIFKGKTSSGFEYTLDPERLDDYRLLELLSEAKDNLLKLPSFVEKILGAEQKAALLKHLEDKYGRVPMKKMEQEMTEIFEQNTETKNS